jgi:hypothetical protein
MKRRLMLVLTLSWLAVRQQHQPPAAPTNAASATKHPMNQKNQKRLLPANTLPEGADELVPLEEGSRRPPRGLQP